jgi:hypothetical protein
MCAKMPGTREEFLSVSGVGNAKVEKYFERFSAVISEHQGDIKHTVNVEADILTLFRLKKDSIFLSSSPLSVTEFCAHIAGQLRFSGNISPLEKAVESVLISDGYAKYDGGGRLVVGDKPNPDILRRCVDFDEEGGEIYAPWLAAGAQGWVLERLKV